MQLIGASKDAVHLDEPGSLMVHRLVVPGGVLRVQDFSGTNYLLVAGPFGEPERFFDSQSQSVLTRSV